MVPFVLLFVVCVIVLAAKEDDCSSPSLLCVPDNFPTIQEAVDAVENPGDTVAIRAGTYRVALEITKSCINSSLYFEIRPFGMDEVILVHDTTKNNAMDVMGAWWRIHSGQGQLTFQSGEERTAALIDVHTAGFFGPFRMVTVSKSKKMYMIMARGKGPMVFDSIVFDAAYGAQPYFYGVSIMAASHVFVQNCVFSKNVQSGVAIAASSSFINVMHNQFVRTGTSSWASVSVNQGGHDIVISNNVFETTGKFTAYRGSVEIASSFGDKVTNVVVLQNSWRYPETPSTGGSSSPVISISVGVAVGETTDTSSGDRDSQERQILSSNSGPYITNVTITHNEFVGSCAVGPKSSIVEESRLHACAADCSFIYNVLQYPNTLVNYVQDFSIFGNRNGTSLDVLGRGD